MEGRKKYSHVDLIHMIGGMDAERGTVTAGGRGYYLMVRFGKHTTAMSQYALCNIGKKCYGYNPLQL